MQWSAWHADGHDVPIEMTLIATVETTGQLLHILAHDITIAQRVGRFPADEAAVARGLATAESSSAAAGHLVEAVGVKWDGR
ncbi:hypothetical protein [Actinoplanes xinjiangensis]|uniref:hypothetical protein n=1 Tax=Actinoplanes xinjiangensis TaxID=512350 RepID=UPI0034416FB8